MLLEELVGEQLLPKQVLFQEKLVQLLEIRAVHLLPQHVLFQEKLVLQLEEAG